MQTNSNITITVGNTEHIIARQRIVRTLKFNGDRNAVMIGIKPAKEFKIIFDEYFKAYGIDKVSKNNKSRIPCRYIRGTTMRMHGKNKDINFDKNSQAHILILEDIKNECKNYILRKNG